MSNESTTVVIQKELEKAKNPEDLKAVFAKYQDKMYYNYGEWLKSEMEARHMTTKDIIFTGLDITPSYISEIKNGKKTPQREKVIILGLAMRLSVDELNKSLKLAGHSSLYSKNPEDCVIITGINNHWEFSEIDDQLQAQLASWSLYRSEE